VDPGAVARRRVTALAGHEGHAAQARAGLGDDDAGVRATALGALVRLGVATADDLRRAMSDAAPAVRRRAVEEAPGSGLDVVADLVGLLEDGDPGVVAAAADALAELERPVPGAVEALVVCARHHDVLVREAAVAALGGIGDGAGLQAVLRACEDVATVRRRAVLALAAFEGAEVDGALERLTSDRDRQVRQAAEDLLHGWGGA
jgi:HEAT repeat protein